MNILIVDDETVQLESLSIGLRGKGYKVLTALNAEKALNYLNNNHYKVDMVLTDYAMPGMNGMELLKKIREKHNSLPVIMITAYGEKDLVINALRNRCDSFIEKPFNLDQLLHEIERAKINILQNTNSHRLSEIIPKLVHQINNPLMSIMGCAELGMLQLDDTEAIKKRMTDIIKATEKIQEINREILKLGQRTEDKIELVSIGEVLDDCLKTFEGLMILKDVSLERDLDGQHLSLLGSRFGLEQVFKNLILNAIDSMDGRPEKRIKISAEMDRAASSISINIQDTGCGIPEESLDQIFTPYFTTKKQGTGLGLPVVKHIVEKHKGEVEVQSEAGEGSTFAVRLPIVD